jgi:spectinomycin phosphotransferase
MKADTSGIDTRDLTQRLDVAYDLRITGLSFLPIGEEGYSYRVETASGSTYFLKAYAASGHHAESLEQAFWLISWLRIAHGQDVVLAPYGTRAGAPYVRYGDYLIALFAYIEGITAMEEPLTDAAWQRMAALLAGVHESVNALPQTLAVRKDVFDIPYRATLLRLLQSREEAQGLDTPIGRQVDRLLREQHDDIAATLRMLEEAQATGRGEERRLVLTHGDPNLANIIKDAHGQLYLIDWGAIALGPPERDLVFFTGPRFEMFLRAYVRGGGQLALCDDISLCDDIFGFYLYHWILQEISDYGTRILAGCAHDDELRHYWQEFQQYVPIHHDEVIRGTQAVRETLQRIATTEHHVET